MNFHLKALLSFAALASIYWGMLAISYFGGWWPVMSMSFNLMTGNPVWALDVIANLALVFVGYVVAMDLENEA